MVGIEWLIDATGCDPELLRNQQVLMAVCDHVIAELSLRVVGEGIWHQFPGEGGWTALFLLTESHLTCHTYPEDGIVTFNLYCCRERAAWPWSQNLRKALGASEVHVESYSRGGRAPAEASFCSSEEGSS